MQAKQKNPHKMAFFKVTSRFPALVPKINGTLELTNRRYHTTIYMNIQAVIQKFYK